MRWYIPSFYGDINLEPTGENSCKLTIEKLSPTERAALVSLTEVARIKGWCGLNIDLAVEQTIELKGPIAKVQKVLAKALKPGRKLVSVVRFTDDKMEEIVSAELTAKRDPYRGEKSKADPKAAATVAAPTRGCPAPDFIKAELRANRVLEAFLNEQQVADFRKYNRFVTRGADTGDRYMITSRHARDELATYQRSIYNLDRKVPVCAHDWDIPAAEEMLGLHLLLSIPFWESWLINLADPLVHV